MKTCALLVLACLACSHAAQTRDRRGNNNFGSKAPTRTQTNYASSGAGGGGHNKDEKVLRNDMEMKNDGSYHYEYETSNGIAGHEQGLGGVSVQGSSSYISPEGIEVKTTYVADETGYHPVGDHIPKTPDYILRALEYIRTHPYQLRNQQNVGASTRQSAYAVPKLDTHIAPPTYRPTTAPRRSTPTKSTRYNAGPAKQTSNARNQYKQVRGSSKYFKY